jgi:hypothetical protein
VSLFGNVVTNVAGHEHTVIHGLISSELGVLKNVKKKKKKIQNAYEVPHLNEM